MAYVTGDGRVVQSRPWSFAALIDMFWGLITVVGYFFQTLIPGEKKDDRTSDYRRPGSGPGGSGGPRIHGLRRGGAPASSPPMSGGG